jgi:hypothetical protein
VAFPELGTLGSTNSTRVPCSTAHLLFVAFPELGTPRRTTSTTYDEFIFMDGVKSSCQKRQSLTRMHRLFQAHPETLGEPRTLEASTLIAPWYLQPVRTFGSCSVSRLAPKPIHTPFKHALKRKVAFGFSDMWPLGRSSPADDDKQGQLSHTFLAFYLLMKRLLHTYGNA